MALVAPISKWGIQMGAPLAVLQIHSRNQRFRSHCLLHLHCPSRFTVDIELWLIIVDLTRIVIILGNVTFNVYTYVRNIRYHVTDPLGLACACAKVPITLEER